MKKIIILIIIIHNSAFSQNKSKLLRDGNKLYNDSSYNDAEMKYRKSLERDQNYFNASFNLADAIYKQERYQESSALFDALKNNSPNKKHLANIYHNLGNSLVKEQKLNDAIEAYKDALRINPNDNDTRYNLALAQQQQQQQQQQEQEQEQQEQQQQEEKKEEMSKEDAEKMLEAIQQKEKELQEKLQKKKVKGKKSKVLKDW